MKFSYDPDVESFRGEVKQFIANELPPEEERVKRGYEGGFKDNQEEYDYVMGFQKKLANRDWLAMAWPKEYGGGGASHMRQLVYNEEMAYNGAPSMNMGIAWVGPSLMLYGTDEQKERFIPRITGADDWWCTLYSEPGAGSDLAALQTRAVRDGDDYVINGQKIWTSGGHLADWGWMAARTDPDAPKHKGITMFMLDMKSPGITVRPLINIANRHGFNEVFFEDV
ncbi:MAG: acyl-CoA dehydrogenase family protein, partial [Dehalococcoidia bacterium]